MNPLDINLIAFSLMAYPISYLELIATLFGLASVYLATKENILTWPSGIVNEIGFFCLFFQVGLYAGMLLQVIFFAVTLYGWYYWKKAEDRSLIVDLKPIQIMMLVLVILLGGFLFNLLVANLHHLIPSFIQKPASQSVLDSIIAATSIAAFFLLAKKVLISWVLWIVVDLMSIGLFISQQLYLVAIEYAIFLCMAIYGYHCWRKRCVQ